MKDDHQPDESRTTPSPDAVAGDDFTAQFALALRLPDLWYAWHEAPAVDGVVRRLWVATIDTTSWAAIDEREHGGDTFTVWQSSRGAVGPTGGRPRGGGGDRLSQRTVGSGPHADYATGAS
ncbi:hypothetical protein [Streptomyces sp. C36]|uniref:hypothetical protein n=1 Tax=Streptomyces sp. C36 TaxID=3237122 RepID=UPI0034C6AB0B